MATTPTRIPVARPIPGEGRVVTDVMQLRARADYEPLKLRAAMENLHRLHRAEDAQALDYALQELIVAAMATMDRIRRACPEVEGPPA